MKNIELPEPFKDVMVTYNKTFYSGPYKTVQNIRTITKRGFYSNLFEYFSVPDEYAYFNGNLLPHGFGGDRLLPKQVIKWEYCKE
jgi:hypothetical protein